MPADKFTYSSTIVEKKEARSRALKQFPGSFLPPFLATVEKKEARSRALKQNSLLIFSLPFYK